MREIRAVGDKILATMIDGYDFKTTKGGVILQEKDATSEAIRPRWFEVTHVGPEQSDVKAGEYVLVHHGRWTRGIALEGHEDKIYMLDPEYLLATSDEMPESFV
jgi:hypothetical protein